MSTTSSFGKLRKHDLEINRLSEQESYETKNKIIVLKIIIQKERKE